MLLFVDVIELIVLGRENFKVCVLISVDDMVDTYGVHDLYVATIS